LILKRVRLPNQEGFIEKRVTKLSAYACLVPNSLNWGKVLFRLRRDFLSNWRDSSWQSRSSYLRGSWYIFWQV
jgi:hypothetical protein